VDVKAATLRGQIQLLDAAETLAAFMVDGEPDWGKFKAVIGPVMERANRRPVRAYGEMVDLLWRDGNPGAALQLEELWHRLGTIYPFALLCGYVMRNFYREEDGQPFEEVCARHSQVLPTEEFGRLEERDLRLREVTRLQQRAQALEDEVAQRKLTEMALREALEQRDEAVRELHEAAQERGRLAEREQAANRAKDEFLAMLGHELRNPLAPILTALQLMRARLGETAVKERAVIERQVGHLVRLVDDLLDVSRITRGKVELKKHPLELAQVVSKAVEMSCPLLEERRHKLTIEVPSQGLCVEGDEHRLAQVVANLLSNAAKYTESGGKINVNAGLEAGMVTLRVRDSGAGIPPELLPRLFGMFVQGERTIDRSQGGLGLGLAIVENLVAMHGGKVSAHSEGHGKGSEFVVRLPVHQPGASEPRVDLGPRSHSVPSRRILVIDDNCDAGEVLSEALALEGHTAQVVFDGPTALEIARAFRPEVALVDIGLPVMDGYELARRLRELPELAGIKLVAVTGYGQESDRQRSREAGFHAHLVKPIDLDQMGPVLTRLFEGS
jgi:signal transduction histidine kinase